MGFSIDGGDVGAEDSEGEALGATDGNDDGAIDLDGAEEGQPSPNGMDVIDDANSLSPSMMTSPL